MKAIAASWICPVAGPPLRDAAVIIQDGRIADVSRRIAPGSSEASESFPGCAILPGFVNTHTHLELTLLRGFLEDLPFPEWIRKLTRTKYEHLSPEEVALSARLGAIECLQAGVTTLGEVMDIGASWEVMNDFGLCGVAYQEVFGPDPSQALDALAALKERVGVYRTEETAARRVGVSPHAVYTVSSELFRAAADFARTERLPVAIHLSESKEEVAFIRDGSGDFADALENRGIPVRAEGVGPIEYLDRLGVLGSRTLAIHAIEASDTEVRCMADRGVAVAHCPKSNLKLGHSVAPVLRFLDSGLRVGLGSDSVASNNHVDMFEEMRSAIYLQRLRSGKPDTLGAARALRMATLDGAHCLGLEMEVGSLEVGKRADLTIVDFNDPSLRPVYDPVNTIVYSATRKNVVATYLEGARVRPEAGEILEEAQRTADRLKREMARSG